MERTVSAKGLRRGWAKYSSLIWIVNIQIKSLHLKSVKWMWRHGKRHFLRGVFLSIVANQHVRSSIVSFISWCHKSSLVCWLFFSRSDNVLWLLLWDLTNKTGIFEIKRLEAKKFEICEVYSLPFSFLCSQHSLSQSVLSILFLYISLLFFCFSLL